MSTAATQIIIVNKSIHTLLCIGCYVPTIHVLVLSAAEIHVPAGPVHRPRRTAGPDRGGGADAAAHRRHRAVAAGEAIGGNAAQVNDDDHHCSVSFFMTWTHTHTITNS